MKRFAVLLAVVGMVTLLASYGFAYNAWAPYASWGNSRIASSSSSSGYGLDIWGGASGVGYYLSQPANYGTASSSSGYYGGYGPAASSSGYMGGYASSGWGGPSPAASSSGNYYGGYGASSSGYYGGYGAASSSGWGGGYGGASSSGYQGYWPASSSSSGYY